MYKGDDDDDDDDDDNNRPVGLGTCALKTQVLRVLLETACFLKC